MRFIGTAPKLGLAGAGLCLGVYMVSALAQSGGACCRGREGSTFQDWTFSTGANPASPEVSSNAYGSAGAFVTLGFMASGWLQDAGLGTLRGHWDLGATGQVTVVVPDQAALPVACKYVSVEVTYWDDPPLFVVPTVSVAGASRLGGTNWVVEDTGFGSWSAYRSWWRVDGSSDSETIVVTAGPMGGIVDRLVVDTCLVQLPSPADLVVAADSGQCSKSNVSYVGLPAVDGCVLTSVSCSPPSGATFPVGVTVVNCQVTDAWGGARAISFRVTVDDVPAEQWRLSVRRVGLGGETLELCWPASCVPAVLEESEEAGSGTGWKPVGLAVECTGSQCRVSIQAGQGTKFFRLRRF